MWFFVRRVWRWKAKKPVCCTSPYDVICLANSISVAPPPGTRRLSCGKTTPKHNVLLKASITFYCFRIFLVYQECSRNLVHSDLVRIGTNIHYKGNLPEFTHSFQCLWRKTASFVKSKIMQWVLCLEFFGFFLTTSTRG